MNQNIFETRQRASELLEEVIKIWQKSDQSEYLEGLDTDPVFKLLINALAYQANELQSDIEVLKDEILEEFDSMLARGEGCKAVPAVAVITAHPAPGISETVVNSDDEFFLVGESGNRFTFTPLFKTRVISANVSNVSRIDGRRWAVKLSFANLVQNISGFTFAIPFYRLLNLKVTFADTGKEIPLITQADNAFYPIADYFSLDTVLYNRLQAVSTGGIRSGMTPYSGFMAADLLARSLVSHFAFGDMENFSPVRELNLIFELSGIDYEYSLTANDLKLNVLFLVNAHRSTVALSTENPIAKLDGRTSDERSGFQFLHLLPPTEDSSVSEVPIQVRRVNMERFNEGRLLRLLQNLIVKYSSDYYAFASIGAKTSDSVMRQIQKNLSDLIHLTKARSDSVNPGTYAYLDIHKSSANLSSLKKQDSNLSFRVDYIVTDGAEVNKDLKRTAKFSGPQWLDESKVTQVIEPVPGMNEILNKKEERAISKYYLSTENRIVTPYDVKLFCYTELLVRYGVANDMVEGITFHRKEAMVGGYRTYEGVVIITLKANEFVERAFSGKIEMVQSYLARMIWIRTNGVYPLNVKLVINK